MKPFQDLQNHQPKKKHCGAYLEGELITSKAWFSMRSPSAYQIYCLFESMVVKKPVKGKKNEYSYPNARKLKLTYKQAWDSYGIEQSKFTHAVDELIAHGFIDIVLHGNASAREQTIYGISRRWRVYGTEHFRAEPRIRTKRGFCEKSKKRQKQGAIHMANF